MISYPFFRTVLDQLESILTPIRLQKLQFWLDSCEQNSWHPLDFDPEKFLAVDLTIDKNVVLAFWEMLNFVREEVYDCPEYQQRWIVMLELRHDPSWTPDEPLDELPDVDLRLPAHLLDQDPFSSKDRLLPPDMDLPTTPTWQGRRGSYRLSHRPILQGCPCGHDYEAHAIDLFHLLDDMDQVHYDREGISTATDIVRDYVYWCLDKPFDPLHLSPNRVGFYTNGIPVEFRREAWESLRLTLQHMMSNCSHPQDYLPWWESFNRTPLSLFSDERSQHLRGLRDDAVRSLGEAGWDEMKIVRLIHSDLTDYVDLPDVVFSYVSSLSSVLGVPLHSDDRVFSEPPSEIRAILQGR